MSYTKYPIMIVKSSKDKLDILLSTIDSKDIVVIDNLHLKNSINYEIVLNMLKTNKLSIKNTYKIELCLEDLCRVLETQKLSIRIYSLFTMENIDELTYNLSRRVINEIQKLIRKRVSREVEDYIIENVVFPLLIWCDSSEKHYANTKYILIHPKYLKLVEKLFFKQ